MPPRSPPNGCLCVVLVAHLHVGGAQRSDLQPTVPLTGLVTGPAPCVFQVIVQSGRQPSVLQKLCQLPFQYFSHPRLIRVLFPSLISACYNNSQNKVILQQEMSCVLLATFIQVNMGPWSHIQYMNVHTLCIKTSLHSRNRVQRLVVLFSGAA